MTARPVGALALEFLCDATLTVHADRRTVAARAYADGEALIAERDALKQNVRTLTADRERILREADARVAVVKAQADALAESMTDLVCLHSCGLYAPIPEHWTEQTKQVITEARTALAAHRAAGGGK